MRQRALSPRQRLDHLLPLEVHRREPVAVPLDDVHACLFQPQELTLAGARVRPNLRRHCSTSATMTAAKEVQQAVDPLLARQVLSKEIGRILFTPHFVELDGAVPDALLNP